MAAIISTKRALALLLSIVLLLGCCTGCVRKNEKATEPEQAGPALAPTSHWDTEPTAEPTEATEAETEPPATEPTEAKAKGFPGTVAENSVNVRSTPSTTASSSMTLNKGDRVDVQYLDMTGVLPWGKIDEGWVRMDLIKLDDPDAVLPFTTPELGITINDGAFVYTGPGTFYDQAGYMKIDSRVEIQGIFGMWARIAEGWLLVDHLYVDGHRGPQEPVKGTVTGTGVNVRIGPGIQYDVVTTVSAGTRLEILHQVTLANMTWGCTETGWLSMDYVLLDTDPAAAIIGTWYGHTMQSADGFDHTFSEWTFKANGSYSRTSWYYNENTKEHFKYADGVTTGKFTFDGNVLMLDSTACSAYVKDGKLYIDEGFGERDYLSTSLTDAFEAFMKEKYPS